MIAALIIRQQDRVFNAKPDMMPLTATERAELEQLLATGEAIPEWWRYRLFPDHNRSAEVGKEYRLVYDGKLKREEVLAKSLAAPWQLDRVFCSSRPHGGGWRNLLVWGDNLLALRELLNDQQGANLFGTRGKIKLIYIDPPFATRQDFMKDKEKAYRDKVIGSQFIEFLRRRLILLHELLADDGSIYVHLDWKKGHYIKAVLDEVFGEENFRNEVIWRRSTSHADANKYGQVHDSVFFYTKSDQYVWNSQFRPYAPEYIARYFRFSEPDGRKYWKEDASGEGKGPPRRFGDRWIAPPKGRHWRWVQKQIDDHWEKGRFVFTKSGRPEFKRYLDEQEGEPVSSIWDDIKRINQVADERTTYPTQKPEGVVERIIRASSNKGDIVLDAFAGSGTVAAVSEKLERRWIAMDCGKLAIYTTQKRLFSLTKGIGSAKKDDRAEPDRVDDWPEHLKNAPAVLLITEKARKGECDVTLDLLGDLAALATKHKLIKKGATLSLVCPAKKLKVPKESMEDLAEGPGTKRIEIAGVVFRLSIIAPKDKSEKSRPLPAKEFALYRAGVYDMTAIKGMSWEDYRPFVLKLFGVHKHPHARYGFGLDGYIGTHSVLIWNYPDYKSLTLDYGYVDDLHKALRGKPGERFNVIAPVVAMAFAEDEVTRDGATYVFLKVPLSVLLRLIEHKEPAALKQPAKEADVNEVIDAAGFDFVSQPQVIWKAKKETPSGELFADYVLEISEFRAQTLATDPEDFKNFEAFSMAMLDLDYRGDVFQLSRVFWGEDLIKAAGGLAKAERLELRIAEQDFAGDQMMVILCDRYGNEKRLRLEKPDFEGTGQETLSKAANDGRVTP